MFWQEMQEKWSDLTLTLCWGSWCRSHPCWRSGACASSAGSGTRPAVSVQKNTAHQTERTAMIGGENKCWRILMMWQSEWLGDLYRWYAYISIYKVRQNKTSVLIGAWLWYLPPFKKSWPTDWPTDIPGHKELPINKLHTIHHNLSK